MKMKISEIPFRKILDLILLFVCLSINAQSKWVKVMNQECTYYEPYYEEGFTAKWNGGISNGKANGIGTLEKFQNGRKYGIYEGSIIDGQLQGHALYTFYQENGGKRVFEG